MKKTWLVVLLFGSVMAAHAETPQSTLEHYRQQAGGTATASAGRALYYRDVVQNGKTMSCAKCHTADPKKTGMTPAYREIGPLAPVANPRRLTDLKKTEKWFRRNCDDVLARECTPQEKADFVAWLVSLR